MARKYSFYAKYEMTKEERESAYWYAMRYNKWRAEYNALADEEIEQIWATIDGKRYYIRADSPEELGAKIKLIEQTAIAASPELYQYILFAVTNKRTSFAYLQSMMNIPCDKDTYYEARRRFYYYLAQYI